MARLLGQRRRPRLQAHDNPPGVGCKVLARVKAGAESRMAEFDDYPPEVREALRDDGGPPRARRER